MNTAPPSFPDAKGPNPARAAFLLEVAGALEFLALFHRLSAEQQRALIDQVSNFAAAAATPRKEPKS